MLVGALVLGSQTASAQDNDATLTYSAYESGSFTPWGTNKKENYGIAIHLTDPSLVGMTISKVRVPFGSNVNGLSNGTVFLTKELSVKSKKNVADISVDSFAIASNWVEVTLAEPYTITSDGVYVGYTFDEDAQVNTPVATVAKTSSGDFYVFTSRTYRKWADKSEQLGRASALQVILTNAPANAAGVSFTGMVASKGDKPTVLLTISNHGSAGVKSIDYTYTFGSTTESVHYDFRSAIQALFNKSSNIRLTLPEITETGSLPLQVTIDKVNGEANGDVNPSHTANILVYPFVPKKRAIVEEYTGTWCGYCPRGFVGLEHMNELYPDDFIGVSYHNGDPMEFTSNFPSSVSGFPAAWLDRVKSTDAYCGDNYNGHFNIDDTWNARNEAFTPLDVTVKAYYTDEAQTQIKAVSAVKSPIDLTDANYQLSYILVANGLTQANCGDNTGSWAQSNYYSGQSGSYPDDDMYQFTHGGASVSGLTYNFVMCGWSGRGGLTGSIPTVLTADVPSEHSYTFDLADAVNTSGKTIWQDKDKMEVVVLVLDPATGEVLNANKTKVYADEATGVTSLHSGDTIAPTAFYSADGKRLNGLQKGLNIVRMSNGVTKKMVR